MSYRHTSGEGPLVVAFGGRVFGMDPATGARLWTYEGDAHGVVRLAPSEGLLFVHAGGTLACLNAASGAVVWSALVATGDTLLVGADAIFVGGSGEVRCYARADGRLLWEEAFKGMGLGDVALALGAVVAQADRSG